MTTRKEMQAQSSFNVVLAVVKIQSAWRAYKARQNVKMLKDMPNLKDPKTKEAAVKIQSVYRGFQTRKKNSFQKSYTLDMVMAVVKIQRSYRKYRVKKIEAGLPNLKDPEVKKATVMIQSSFRGFKTRKDMTQGNKKPTVLQSKIKADEMDFKRRPKKGFQPTLVADSSLTEKKGELLVHPGDVGCGHPISIHFGF